MALTPPEKKINLNKTVKRSEAEKRDQHIKSLELKNVTLVETAEKRQDQLTRQANIIGELRPILMNLK